MRTKNGFWFCGKDFSACYRGLDRAKQVFEVPQNEYPSDENYNCFLDDSGATIPFSEVENALELKFSNEDVAKAMELAEVNNKNVKIKLRKQFQCL